MLFANQFPWLIFLINQNLADQLYNVKYIAPLRATAERYYRAQDLSVKEVDFQGKNLAMFIKNLSDKEKTNYSEWLKENFGFNLLSISVGGHLSLRLQYNNSDSSYNITDMGFGFSQILPIITQLWYSTNEKQKLSRPFNRGDNNGYLIIEQPELHLHPRFQAKMVDVFVRAINLSKKQKSNIFIIIETHSETIINQVGHRISKSMLDKEDVSITIFDKQSSDKPTNVKLSSYDSNGYLNDWPWGFFEPDLS